MSVQFTNFEEEIVRSFAIPAPRPAFKQTLALAFQKQHRPRPFFLSRASWCWNLAAALTLLLCAVFLAVGPRRVLAQIQTWLGYVPGRGYIELNTPLRVLAQPVKVTREDVTVEVLSALLTEKETFVDYTVFGVPAEALPKQESSRGCDAPPFLLLPDGQKLIRRNSSYPAIPNNFSSAILNIPCIANTLPGKAPENWQLPLSFVLGAQVPVSMPVVEEAPTAQSAQTASTETAAPSENNFALNIIRVIETPKGYIVLGTVPNLHGNERYQTLQSPTLTDAQNKQIAARLPIESNLLTPSELSAYAGQGLELWQLEFDITGVTFPITIHYPLQQTLHEDSELTANLAVDLGQNPELGRAVVLNKEVQLGSQTFTLLSVTPQHNGYSFSVQMRGKQTFVGIEIEGAQAVGAGGGLNPETKVLNTSTVFESRPQSPFILRFSHLITEGETIALSTTWLPQTPHAPLLVNEAVNGPCLEPNKLNKLSPEALAGQGWLLTAENTQPGKQKLLLSDLASQNLVEITQNSAWAEFSADGKEVFYTDGNQIKIFEISSNTTRTLEVSAYDRFELSPDGEKIAYIATWTDGSSEIDITFKTAGGLYVAAKQVRAELAGWSQDSQSLYYLIPSLDYSIWKLMRYNMTNHQSTELFSITDATPKFINASISPDGKWIAYRAKDNSSVRLIGADGQNARLLAENASIVRIKWISGSQLILSSRLPSQEEIKSVLVNMDDCNLKLLALPQPGLVQGLKLP
ncbi:MAG: hypothetical protein VB108_03985 [Anaerolineaceae bacterium]|nr:hypothetical protein [Anaerolineaceae bacterium]